MSDLQNGPKQADFVSSLPDYAQVFMFLRQFGELLALPPVSLSELEEFFLTRHNDEEDKVVGIHWRLLISVTRRENRRDWKKMATRFAMRNGLIKQGVPYSDIPLEKRVNIMKLTCEAQFDCNLPFKAELKKMELASDEPVGVDRLGRRYWLLQDSFHDVRLYRESGYDVLPPGESSWVLLARSIDEMDVRIMNLVGKNDSSGNKSPEVEEVEKMEVDGTESGTSHTPKMSRSTRVTSTAKKEGKKDLKKPASEETGGCFVCSVDNDYQNMLLCDSCDGECHMYCHYPRLWTVPRGRWECPLCNEKALIEKLKENHTQLATGRFQLEKVAERKQRNVTRLQRTGLLLQNIIMSDSGNERTRRARKAVNYAELNDVYLPPLGPSDFVASGDQQSLAKSGGESLTRCVGTRASRRLRELTAGASGEFEQLPVTNSSSEDINLVEELANPASPDLTATSPETDETYKVSQRVGDVDVDIEDHRQELRETPNSDQHLRAGELLAGVVTKSVCQLEEEWKNTPLATAATCHSSTSLGASDLPTASNGFATVLSTSDSICKSSTVAESRGINYQ